MASDTFADFDGVSGRAQKIYRVKARRGANRRPALIGFSGNLEQCLLFVAWYERGADPTRLPAGLNRDYDYEAMVMDASGLYVYTSGLVPFRIADGLWAAGSGTLPALAALRSGYAPLEAVKSSTLVDPHSRPPLESYTLGEPRENRKPEGEAKGESGLGEVPSPRGLGEDELARRLAEATEFLARAQRDLAAAQERGYREIAEAQSRLNDVLASGG